MKYLSNGKIMDPTSKLSLGLFKKCHNSVRNFRDIVWMQTNITEYITSNFIGQDKYFFSIQTQLKNSSNKRTKFF